MKAIGLKTSLPIHEEESFIAFETNKPEPQGHDLLVKVEAVSVNPVDYKVRQGSAKDIILEEPKILGWDAVGKVTAVGEMVSLFNVGDEVYYAGDITRSGSNAAYQLVDERIVGRKPKTLSYEESAAVPLTALTAWEAIFERMAIQKNAGKGKTILVISGAGGVGSIAIQLLKQLTQLKVIATASRKESTAWCQKMGGDLVVNHYHLVEALQKEGVNSVDYILNLVDVDSYWAIMNEIIKPQGRICCIVPPKNEISIGQLFRKSVSVSWELMFTRSTFQTEDMINQHFILNEIADLYDQGILKPYLTESYSGLTVENFQKAHAQLESGTTIGKLVIRY